VGAAVTERQAQTVAKRFLNDIMSPHGFSYDAFEGTIRDRLKPLLSKRLLGTLDNVHNCGRDWAAHQPPGSTDKPPFVDCCVFSDSNDWNPTSFALIDSSPMPDGSRRVKVKYCYDSPTEHAQWYVAIYITEENGRFVVDDFEGEADEAGSQPRLLSKVIWPCKAGRWTEAYN